MAASVPAAGKSSRSRKAADRESSAQRNAGGSGGRRTRRQETGKPCTQMCAPGAAGSLQPTGTAGGNIAGRTATSGQGSGMKGGYDEG